MNPKTKAILEKNGLKLAEVPMSEFAKMDGGLTCLSIPLNTKKKTRVAKP